jgi:hypothetical protein
LLGVDLIQHRYGWTDEIVFNLAISRFTEITETALYAYREEHVFGLQTAAFTSWLTLTYAHGMKASWNKFLKSHGLLLHDTPMTDEQKIELTRQAIDKANNIVRMDKKRHSNTNG